MATWLRNDEVRDLGILGLGFIGAACFVEILGLLGIDRSYTYHIAARIAIMALFGIAFNIAFGYCGILSFGHALLYGGGGYIVGILSVKMGVNNMLVTLPMAAIGGAALGAMLGLVTMRNVGMAVVLITFAVAHSVWLILQINPLGLTNGEGGLSGIGRHMSWSGGGANLWTTERSYYWLCAGIILGTCIALRLCVASRIGLAMRAVRDEPTRADTIGLNVKAVRALAFAISGAAAGIAGGLGAMLSGVVTPEDAHWLLSGDVLLFAVLGGAATFLGPALGACVVVLAEIYLGEITRSWPLLLGLIYVVVIRFAPGGVVGAYEDWRRGRKRDSKRLDTIRDDRVQR